MQVEEQQLAFDLCTMVSPPPQLRNVTCRSWNLLEARIPTALGRKSGYFHYRKMHFKYYSMRFQCRTLHVSRFPTKTAFPLPESAFQNRPTRSLSAAKFATQKHIFIIWTPHVHCREVFLVTELADCVPISWLLKAVCHETLNYISLIFQDIMISKNISGIAQSRFHSHVNILIEIPRKH